MRLPIVDENDVEIGIKERDEVTKDDIFRVSALWVTNSKGEHLVAQRALTKKKHPGKWGPAVAGTVEEGETYEINILKETAEELGIILRSNDLRLGPKVLRHGPIDTSFTQWYFATVDKQLEEFTLPDEEVMAIRWLSTEEFKDILRDRPEEFIPSAPDWVGLVIEEPYSAPS